WTIPQALCGGHRILRITFLAVVDAYLTRLDANCPDISAGINPVPAHINRRIKLESTLTQNCALYYAQHKSSKRRASFFQRFRAADRKRAPETYQQLTHSTRFRRLPFHRDNGR